jgi:DNA-binding MarR family transcriptional regulator
LTGLTSGSTTAMIDRLEKRRLISRRPHPRDRRATVVVLTREAGRRLPPLFKSLAAAMQSLMSNYTATELSVLTDFFERVAGVWQRERKRLQSESHGSRKISTTRRTPSGGARAGARDWR